MAWLFTATPDTGDIDYRPLAWALMAGISGDIALNFYVNQYLGVADRQDTGSVLDEVAGEAAEAANSATTEMSEAHEERRRLQQQVKDLQKRVAELEKEKAELRE